MSDEGNADKNRDFYLTPTDFSSLIFNAVKGAQNPKVEFEHAELTLREFIDCLDRKRIGVKETDLEVLLAAANLMDECGKFFHPYLSFDKLVSKLLEGKNLVFDRKYNIIKEKKNGRR